MISKKKGQLKKISLAIILVLLLATIIIAAQNINEETQQEIQTTETQENANLDLQIDKPETINTDTKIEITDNTLEAINLCENIRCDASNLICVDGFTATCENSCVSETGDCTSCTPSCEGHEQITDNGTENETEIIKNETEERTEGNETTRPEQNEKIPSGTGEAIIDMPSNPELDLLISYPAKITRGEIMEIKATITNSGNKVKNVLVDWALPKGFEIVYWNQKSCESLNTGESCELIIRVQTSLSTSLGEGEIKAIVNYEI